jgi:hypothetical protein
MVAGLRRVATRSGNEYEALLKAAHSFDQSRREAAGHGRATVRAHRLLRRFRTELDPLSRRLATAAPPCTR